MARRYGFSVTLLFTVFAFRFAHAGWTRTYGGEEADQGYCIDYTYDNCYIIVGNTRSFGDGWRTWLLKINAAGDTLWTRTYEGSGACVVETSDKGFIIAGGSRLLKTDSIGDTLWSRNYSIGEEWGWWGSCVQETSDDGYIITGGLHPVDAEPDNWTDLLLLKVDSVGDSLWVRTYGTEGYDWGNYVKETSDGGYVVCGYWNSINGLWDASAWWLKTDSGGNYLWDYRLGKGPEYSYVAECIQETSDHGFIISGSITYYVGSDSNTQFLIKTDPYGYTEWIKKPYNECEIDGQYVQQTSDGGYITTGHLWNLCKTDENGDIMWTRNYGGSGYCVLQTTDEGYIVTGTKEAGTYPDIWLLKTDANGDTISSAVEEQVMGSSADWHVCSLVGTRITLRYSNYPQGFAASVYDASGRKVDEIHSTERSGMIVWGECYGAGVYFIVPNESKANPVKVILIK